jgi:hypothetical protein
VSPTQTPPGTLLGKDQFSNSGSTTSEAIQAACIPGTTNQCSSYPITYASLCHSMKPPPPSCTSQLRLGKCCPNPDGGKGVTSLSQSLQCSAIH